MAHSRSNTRTSLLFSRSSTQLWCVPSRKTSFLRCIGLLNGPYKVYERSTEARWKNFFQDAPLLSFFFAIHPFPSPLFGKRGRGAKICHRFRLSPLIHDRRKGNCRGRAGEIEQEFRVRTSPGRAIYSGCGAQCANWEREHVRQPLRACVCGVYVCVCLYTRWLL